MSRKRSLRPPLRRLAVGVLLAALALPTSARASVASETQVSGKVLGIEMKVQQFTLDNGLRVYVLEDHSTPMFSLHLAFEVGSRDEEPGRTGFAHFFEHMMFKGSENVPDGGHFRYVLGAGGDLNAFTTPDRTEYYDILPSHYLDLSLWLQSDRLKSLAVTEENFENQRNAVLEEKAMRYDNVPYTLALLEFQASMWEGTGYGHLTIGSTEDLEAAKRSDVKAFFDRYYVPNNAVLSIVGDVQYDEVKRKVDEYFGPLKRGEDRPARSEIDHTQSAPFEKVVEDKLAQQPMYLVGWKTVPADHADRPAVDILMNVLLRGDSSRITRILKDEKHLVLESVPMPNDASGGHDAGAAMGAFIPVQGASFKEIRAVIEAEVAKIKKTGISPKELQKSINQLTVDTVSSLSTNDGRAELIAAGALLDGDPIHVLTDLEAYRKVTAADIKRVANKYLTSNWLVLQIVPKK
jgi:zinc protease